MAGLLALVGGAEFTPGNQAQDEMMVSAVPAGPAYVVSTAAREGRAGAVLAGSSAGAMGLCEWVLLRDRRPAHDIRRFAPGLGLVPGCAVLPHFDSFGRRWVASALERMPQPPPVLLGLDERTAAVWDGGGWRAEGPGTVTVIRAGAEAAVLRSGEQLSIHGPAGEQR